jgi:hypothetical protein
VLHTHSVVAHSCCCCACSHTLPPTLLYTHLLLCPGQPLCDGSRLLLEPPPQPGLKHLQAGGGKVHVQPVNALVGLHTIKTHAANSVNVPCMASMQLEKLAVRLTPWPLASPMPLTSLLLHCCPAADGSIGSKSSPGKENSTSGRKCLLYFRDQQPAWRAGVHYPPPLHTPTCSAATPCSSIPITHSFPVAATSLTVSMDTPYR